MVDPKKWTTKTNEAIAAAMQLATTNSNPELTPDHVKYFIWASKSNLQRLSSIKHYSRS